MEEAKQVYEDEVDYLLSSTKYLRDATDELQEDIAETKAEVESVEMYGRRNIFEIDGYGEDPDEDTNKIALRIFHDLGLVNVTFKDICRSHRTSRRRKKKYLPRPIYVKLVNHDLKDEVLKRRHRLRQMPQYRHVYLDENLTKQRRKLYSRVRREVGSENCYTNDGTIFVKLFENTAKSNDFQTRKINNTKDFINIFDKHPYRE